MVYLNAPEGVVTSNPVGSVKDFIGQRVGGKWKHNTDPLAKWLAVFIAAAHFFFCLAGPVHDESGNDLHVPAHQSYSGGVCCWRG